MAYGDVQTVPPDPIDPLAIKDDEDKENLRLKENQRATQGSASPNKMERKSSTKDLQKMKSREQMGAQNIFATIVWNPLFENTTMGVIVLNAIWIGVDTEWNHDNLIKDDKKPLEPYSTVVENLFCTYFTVELTIRFLSYRRKRHCLTDGWFVFDGTLVVCMVLETWIMPLVGLIAGGDSNSGLKALGPMRLLRLLRLARMGKIMRFFPEMLKLVKGMIMAFRSVFWILLFLIIIIYVTSIIFTGALSTDPAPPDCTEEQLEAWGEDYEGPYNCFPNGAFSDAFDTDMELWVEVDPIKRRAWMSKTLFATMGDSFMSLTTRGVLGDNLAETFDVILEEWIFYGEIRGLILVWVFIIFLLITFATLLNMLIGVVCDIISDAAKEEEDAQTVNMLKYVIEDAFAQIDCNEDGLVCKEEWGEIKNNPMVRKSLESIGIEEDRMEERLGQMGEMIFTEKPYEAFTSEMSQEQLMKSPSRTNSGFGSRSTRSERETTGLSVTQLIERVIEIRPDQSASSLDMELLRSQVLKDQKAFKKKLKKIEEGVKKALGPAAALNEEDMPDMPALPSTDPMEELMDNVRGVALEEVPLNLLIQVLRQRAPRTDEHAHNPHAVPYR